MTAICITGPPVPNKPSSWPRRGTDLSLGADSWRDQLWIALGFRAGPMGAQVLAEDLLGLYTLRDFGGVGCHLLWGFPPIPGLETPTVQRGWEQEAASKCRRPHAGLPTTAKPPGQPQMTAATVQLLGCSVTSFPDSSMHCLPQSWPWLMAQLQCLFRR